MTSVAELRESTTALENIQAQLAIISQRNDSKSRKDLVAMRRKLAAHIAEVGTLADPFFVALGDQALLEAYREKFSNMRSAAARHQANWPAVLLGTSPAEYRESAQIVRTANREFVAWMRETLEALKP